MCDVFPVTSNFSVYTEHAVWRGTITATQNKCDVQYDVQCLGEVS